MVKTPKGGRPKSTELYIKQDASTKGMTEDTMQAAWKDVIERLQRMERNAVQHATKIKNLQDMYQKKGNKKNARRASAIRYIAVTKALYRKDRTLLQMQKERGHNVELKDKKERNF